MVCVFRKPDYLDPAEPRWFLHTVIANGKRPNSVSCLLL